MIAWKDIINLSDKTLPGFPQEAKAISDFLDKVQSTPEGQKLLEDIKNKYGDKKATIVFSNSRDSHVQPNGGIHFNLQDFHTLQVADPRTGKHESVGLPYVVYHELSHAADPKLLFGEDPKSVINNNSNNSYTTPGPDKISPAEAAATARAAAFVEKYYPDLPKVMKYSDAFESPDFVNAAQKLIEDYRNSAVTDDQLVKNCVGRFKFDYGEVFPSDVTYCQSLPDARATDKSEFKTPPTFPR